MNFPEQPTHGTYESSISTLRKEIDIIDTTILQCLLELQNITHGTALGEALIYSLLTDDAFSSHREILTLILRSIREIPENGLQIAYNEEDEILTILQKINSLLIQRFNVVKKVGGIKKEFQKPPLDANRWKEVIMDRMKKWEEFGGLHGKEFIPIIWNHIHESAIEMEKNITDIQQNSIYETISSILPN